MDNRMTEVPSVVGDAISVPNLKFVGDPTPLLAAITKASEEFNAVPTTFEGQAGARKFQYAKYHVVMKCVRDALRKQGVGLTHPLTSNGDRSVSTLMVSGHGALIMSVYEFPSDKNPQEFGKNHTYYRRYQLQAFFGLEGDKDADDFDPQDKIVVSKESVEPKQVSSGLSPSVPASAKAEPVKEAAKDIEKVKSVNAMLSDTMKKMGWDIKKVTEFAIEQGLGSDPLRFDDKTKHQLLTKLQELNG